MLFAITLAVQVENVSSRPGPQVGVGEGVKVLAGAEGVGHCHRVSHREALEDLPVRVQSHPDNMKPGTMGFVKMILTRTLVY